MQPCLFYLFKCCVTKKKICDSIILLEESVYLRVGLDVNYNCIIRPTVQY